MGESEGGGDGLEGGRVGWVGRRKGWVGGRKGEEDKGWKGEGKMRGGREGERNKEEW